MENRVYYRYPKERKLRFFIIKTTENLFLFFIITGFPKVYLLQNVQICILFNNASHFSDFRRIAQS